MTLASTTWLEFGAGAVIGALAMGALLSWLV